MSQTVATAQKSAKISAAFDAVDRDFDAARFLEPGPDQHVWGAVVYDDCPSDTQPEVECGCWGWDWSDLFHVTDHKVGSREEVEAWLNGFTLKGESGYHGGNWGVALFWKSALNSRRKTLTVQQRLLRAVLV